jgi:hypothetical protein
LYAPQARSPALLASRDLHPFIGLPWNSPYDESRSFRSGTNMFTFLVSSKGQGGTRAPETMTLPATSRADSAIRSTALRALTDL